MKTITILRDGNRILVDSKSARVRGLLTTVLTYNEKVFLRGKDYYAAKREHRPTIFDQPWECFVEDELRRIGTSFGYLERVRLVLKTAGYKVKVEDISHTRDRPAYTQDWSVVDNDETIKFRYRQREVLEILVREENGRIDCPPGYGKTYLIGLACMVLPKAKVLVTTDRVPVLCERIYPELCTMLPSVGCFGGGNSTPGRRVICSTFDSLHRVPDDIDIVFIDECHESASDSVANKLARFDRARIFGLSASHDMRRDGKDMRVEGICGPVRIRISYEAAVKHKMIVPVTVLWGNVRSDIDPCAGVEDTVERERLAIWTNKFRNEIIAEDARRYGDDVQVLITVRTIEHALRLKKRLPEYELVYSGTGIDDEEWQEYARRKMLPGGFKPMTDDRRLLLSRRFGKNKLKKVIATTVWNVGVDMKYLAVLIRGDAGSSEINDNQIPGRTYRINEKGKASAIVHDYLDQFNVRRATDAQTRSKNYEKIGLDQIFPEEHKKAKTKTRRARYN